MQRSILLSLICFSLCFLACQSGNEKGKIKSTTAEKKDTKPTANKPNSPSVNSEGVMEKDGLRLTPVKDSPKFSNAKLDIAAPKDESKVKSGEVAFDFNVTDYELGNQTPDADQKMCANSAKGQHIHLILNNQPYSAHYTADFKKELADNHYVGLAFLSRSYHESLKHDDAYELFQFTVGNPEVAPTLDLTAPNIFYSRPKGTYIGEENIKKVMLDFYLTSVTISPNGYKVRATINDKTQFNITSWQPYFIEGLPEGKNKIKLELIDQKGQLIETPFNGVERTFELYKSEPIGQ